MISVVVPAYNEERNVSVLYERIKSVLKTNYEVIFIDDGSTDNTYKVLKKIRDKNLRIIKFRKNFGQTAAMDAGFKAAKGEIIVAMDADLQNDPNDIPKIIAKLKEGYDVVSGWRYDRKDRFTKKLFSLFANKLRKFITGEKIHDSGCSLKAYKKECFKGVNLYGEMHRFIPAILMWKGFKVGELKVNHHERLHGKTKYNVVRVLKGFLDLIVVAFWQRYSARPIHLFGSLGIMSGAAGFFIAAYLTIRKILFMEGIANRPLLLLAILLIIIGVQFVAFGLLADILIKIYYKDDTNYTIEE